MREVIEAIRLFVFNFFTCHECADNFRAETSSYINHLHKPFDAIQYIWSVHNSVNRRLANDQSSDPYHPKVLFPSRTQCPKCYATSNVNTGVANGNESIWVDTEVIAFLTSFYSKAKIEGVKELDAAVDVNQQHFNESNLQKKRDAELLEYRIDADQDIFSAQTDATRWLSIYVVFTVAFVFAFLYVYFSFVKKNPNQKNILYRWILVAT